jgi:hypothetical protein
MTATSPLDLVRPFLWIAAFAFVVGFVAYALLGAGSIARTSPSPDPIPATAPMEPASAATISA